MRRATTLICIILLTSVFCHAQMPTANFSASATSGCSPLVVNFTDQSTGSPTSWLWDFGNGATSNQQNPSTTYFNTGTYTVKLTVTNGTGSNTITKTNYITIYQKPNVNFVVNDSSGCYPHIASFTDLSTPSPNTTNVAWLWDFGNGTQSTQQNPTITYTTSGNFSVTLKVTNDKGCVALFTKPIYIQLIGGIQTSFTNTQPVVCRPPFNISFTNNSTGPGNLSYYWIFGDGNTSTTQSPTHTYNNPGTYSVSLAVTSDQGCSDTLKKINLLNILDINTGFSAPDSICIDEVMSIQNTSTPSALSTTWDFGDGTGSVLLNPDKSYSVPNTYTIKLTNQYSYCTDSATKTIKVNPKPTANFTAINTSRCQPSLVVGFQDLSSGAVSWQWDFGDGATSILQNPVHTYNSYGFFDVTLIVTNGSGCSDTITKSAFVKIKRAEISIPSLPVSGCIPYTINPVAVINSLDNVTSYLWNFGDGTTSTLPNPSHTYSVQGTYTVSLTITTSTGCTDSLVIQNAVRVGRRPVINFSATPLIACGFQPVMFTDLTNEGDEWLWDFGDGGTSTNQHPTHQFSDTGLFTIKLTVTNNGCTDSLKIVDYIRIKPPVAKYGFQTTCDNRLLFNFLDSSIGAQTWFWDFGDGTTSTLQNPVHLFPALGTYNVSLTVTNDTCSHTITKAIKVFDELPDFAASFTTSCRRTTFYFSALSGNLSNIKRFQWDFGDGVQWDSDVANSGGSAYNYYAAAGYYTVTLITTDIYGCKDTAIKPNYIRVNGPTADFTSPQSNGCNGLTVVFDDQSQNDGLNNITSWTWEFGDGSSQVNLTDTLVSHIYNNVGSYTIKLTVQDSTGCIDSIIKPAFVNTSDPQPAFNSGTLGCPNSPIQFYNTSTGNDILSTWYFGNGDTSNLHEPAYPYPDTGVFTVTLVIQDSIGCRDSLVKPNYIKIDRPIASFTVSDSVSSCLPLQVDFVNTSHYGDYGNIWNPGMGGGSGTQTNPTYIYTSPGVYNAQLIIISAGGCRDTAYHTITIYDTAGTEITYSPLNGCSPLPVTLNAITPGPMTFTWDFGDGYILDTSASNVSHMYDFYGDFVPKVIMQDPSGCILPITGLDTIRIIGANAKFGLDNMLFCDQGTVNFIDSTTYNDSISVYSWDFGDGNTSNQQNPTHTYNSPGVYTIQLNVTTQNNCTDTFVLNNIVRVVKSPSIDIGGDSIICIYDNIFHQGLFIQPDTSTVQWQWQLPYGISSNQQNPAAIQYTTSGNFQASVIAINSSGCRDTANRNILVHALPTITLPSVMTIQSGFPQIIPATYSSGIINYNWLPDTGLNCNNCPQPVAGPKFNTLYTVNIVDSNGCKNSGQVQVITICKNANVFIPNTFSPNGDGSNDVFYVRGKGLERVKLLRIFNRWGEIVFESINFPVNNPSYGWTGKYKGNKPVPDVYVYQVEVFCENSQIIRFEGNVALIQ